MASSNWGDNCVCVWRACVRACVRVCVRVRACVRVCVREGGGSVRGPKHLLWLVYLNYSGTSDKGPSEIGMTSLQRTLVGAPC